MKIFESIQGKGVLVDIERHERQDGGRRKKREMVRTKKMKRGGWKKKNT